MNVEYKQQVRSEVYTDKIRWLLEGWTIQGAAKELRRMSEQWVCRTHPRDWQRGRAERLGHFDTGLVMSFLRHNQQMQYGGAMAFMNLKILTILAVDPVSKLVRDPDWTAAADLANTLFAGHADKIWFGEVARKGQITNWQWACFYDEYWGPVTVPHMDLVRGQELWAMSPKNKQETQ